MTDETAPRSRPAALAALTAPETGAIRRGAVLSVVAAALWVPQAALIAWVFAGLLAQGGAPVTPAVIAVLALAGLRIGLTYLAEPQLFGAAERIIATQRARITAREARAGQAGGFGGPGAIAALASEKLAHVIPYVMQYTPARMRTMVVPPVILAIAFWHSWAVGVVLLAAGPLIPVFMALVGWAAQQASEDQMVEIGRMNDLLVDRLAALPDIGLLDAGGQVGAQFRAAAEDLRHRTMRVLGIAFLSSTVLELFAAIGVAMVAVWVGFSLLGEIGWGSWGGALSPFAGMLLLLLAPDYFQPLRDLAGAWHDKAAAGALADDLARWDRAAPTPILGSGAPAARMGSGDITLTGLVAQRGPRRIAYPDRQIPQGARLALTGPSGAGKTTLLRLLAGLERPAAGQITVGGQPLDDATADAWRAGLAWMPQMPHFLDLSLAENITFDGAPDPALIARAGLADVIARLPGGLATRLGETGGGLSGGEARRVMLARALHARPLVVLADEPTADLDAQTAARVIDQIDWLAGQGSTVIVASHDPRLVARMDAVFDIGEAP